jgi:hypothetical protein
MRSMRREACLEGTGREHVLRREGREAARGDGTLSTVVVWRVCWKGTQSSTGIDRPRVVWRSHWRGGDSFESSFRQSEVQKILNLGHPVGIRWWAV